MRHSIPVGRGRPEPGDATFVDLLPVNARRPGQSGRLKRAASVIDEWRKSLAPNWKLGLAVVRNTRSAARQPDHYSMILHRPGKGFVCCACYTY
jgi:hypothetical protein